MSGAATKEEYIEQLNKHIPGTVYLLHFDPPYLHAKHYVGWTAKDPEDRLTLHLNGAGSPLVRAVLNNGGTVSIVRLWEGFDRHFERRLKDHSSSRWCPKCSVRPMEATHFKNCVRKEK